MGPKSKDVLFLLLTFWILLGFVSFSYGAQSINYGSLNEKLTNADCIKCHTKEVLQIEQKGGKHKKVGCLACHKGHYPKIPKSAMIPKCSECHKGKAHFRLPHCERCHSNPHEPLVMNLAKGHYKKECMTCHKKEGEELEKYPTKHSLLACNTCHVQHGYIPSCLKCHKPHLAGQTNKDCKLCHAAHRPVPVLYGMNIPNKYCTACHPKIGKMLASTHTKHRKLKCVFCHRGRHKIIPTCQACHGEPHPYVMVKGRKCLDCHNDAHALIK